MKAMLKVVVKNYTPYSYQEFTLRGEEGEQSKNTEFQVGQLVVINDQINTGFFEVGVVLGCIDFESGELRTDYSGMISMTEIRPLEINDLEDSKIRIRKEMRLEIAGHKVLRNWETNEFTIDLPF